MLAELVYVFSIKPTNLGIPEFKLLNWKTLITDISIPVDPGDLTFHTLGPSEGCAHIDTSDKEEASYGTPKVEEDPPTSEAVKSVNGEASLNFASGSQVVIHNIQKIKNLKFSLLPPGQMSKYKMINQSTQTRS